MRNFWQQLNKPFFVLAPMEQVTDVVFREMFAKYGKPDVLYTEFVSVDGLMHEEGRKKLETDLKYTQQQRPIVAQIWGKDPDKFYEASKYVASLDFDGIDINMGCPQDKEISQGTCAALIKVPKLAQEIVRAVKKGAGDLPVSVKTRIGYTHDETDTWIPALLETEPAAIILHGRTKKEKSKVPARWDIIKKAAEIVHGSGLNTLIVGNGDVNSREEGLRRVKESGVDGVMVGRGAFGSPWFFRADGFAPSIEERLEAMIEHARTFHRILSNKKPFVIMRKHFKAYASGFPGAHELRAKLMEAQNIGEIEKIVQEFLSEKAAV